MTNKDGHPNLSDVTIAREILVPLTQGDSDEGKTIRMNQCFANRNEEDEIYPLTIIEIAEAQKKDRNLKIYYKRNAKTPEKGMGFQLIEDTKVLCKEDKLVIPASLQHRRLLTMHAQRMAC